MFMGCAEMGIIAMADLFVAGVYEETGHYSVFSPSAHSWQLLLGAVFLFSLSQNEFHLSYLEHVKQILFSVIFSQFHSKSASLQRLIHKVEQYRLVLAIKGGLSCS